MWECTLCLIESSIVKSLGKSSALAVLVLIVGCSGLLIGCAGGEQTASVSGKVTFDGEPLSGAVIKFSTEKISVDTVTNADGTFILLVAVAVGENHVVISKWQGIEGNYDASAATDPGQLAAMSAAASASAQAGGAPAVDPHPQLLPAKYSDSAASELKFDVPAGGSTSADFVLTSM